MEQLKATVQNKGMADNMAKHVFQFMLLAVLMIMAAPSMAQSDDAAEDEAAAAYAAENIRYLAEDALRPDTIVRASGLLIHIIRRGDGPIIQPGQQVMVHYEGSLIDGTIFDSTYARDEPVMLQSDNVIRGWEEALTLMTVGSKWEITIPAKLGYAERDDLEIIPAGSTLLFTLELLGAPQR
jgi:FKBP-type peptidyl-prolyl cis-trans isomerase FklB